MSHSCVGFEPGSYICGVVAEESADAEGGGSSPLVAPLVKRVDGDAEEVGDLLD
jgi:hypothetical protein